MEAAPRSIKTIVTAHRQSEGGGFIVRRPLPSHDLDSLDPFLLLDEMGPVAHEPGKAVGAPAHPHRGFETVTYLLQGEMEHKDSTGHQGVWKPGDVQWMTAGSGVVHSEMPSQKMLEQGGPMHGFQIWVNLPAKLKMTKPRYQEMVQEKIPTATTPDGLAKVRVIAGNALGVEAIIDTHTPLVYHDWTIQPGGQGSTDMSPTYNVGVYVFSGTLLLGPDAQQVEKMDSWRY
jgi:quercetin 2,3-dioxygenase